MKYHYHFYAYYGKGGGNYSFSHGIVTFDNPPWISPEYGDFCDHLAKQWGCKRNKLEVKSFTLIGTENVD